MTFPSIRIEGTVLSADLIARLEPGDLKGQRSIDFGAVSHAALKDDIVRAWTHSQAYWRVFHDRLQALKESATGTTETRNFFLIPLFGLLGYSDLEFSRPELVGDKSFPISHRLISHVGFAVHIVSARESLDRKPAMGVGHRSSPHGMVQEYLNLTERLFALVTNGRVLRLLRNSTRLVKLSYVEFDLDRIFGEELFADFAVLYRLLHVSRLPKTPETAADSLLEIYHQDALESGARIRDGLSGAVKATILDFANGFLNHPSNDSLRVLAVAPSFPAQLYPQLLRLVYRLLFLMVIEERDLIFPIDSDTKKRTLYYAHYSLARLRRLAEKRHLADLRYADCWAALRSTFRLFDESGVGHPLGVEPLGGDLFDSAALGSLREATLDNAMLLGCLRNLAVFRDRDTGQLIRANYKHLDVEEFGSVYQGLLEYEPQITAINGRLIFAFVAGDERSRTGSHYTPEELVQPLLKHSLDYLITDALKRPGVADKESALLALRVCDVACGSGHILLAAARRIGNALALLRTGDDQPGPAAFREAVRDVIRHCIYGMDLNPLAVELCKVALWLEAHVPGQPLSFLDHRIHCGNAIVGVARADELKRGISDESFKTLPGDDKEVAAALRKQNKDERKGQQALNFGPHVTSDIQVLAQAYSDFEHVPEQGAGDYYKRRAAYDHFQKTPEHWRLRILADLQTAQFFIPKTRENKPYLTTHDTFRTCLEGVSPIGQQPAMAMSVGRRKRFAHWFIELWDVMNEGGFDLIIGNPPYLGGTKLSGNYGHAFCEWVKWEYAPAGLSDLVVYFLRRIYDLLRPGGFIALITTNSIKDGDVRADGLEQLMKQGGNLTFAVGGTKWPGVANLFVSLFSLYKGPWEGKLRVLDGCEVPFISAFLESYADAGKPVQLKENENKLFEGSKWTCEGFLLSRDEAAAIVAGDPASAEVVLPIINGDDINSHPTQQPARAAVYFADWALERAQRFQGGLDWLIRNVKGEREQHTEEALRRKWWLFKRPTTELYRLIRPLRHCFAFSRHTKHFVLAAQPTNILFTEALKVLTTDRWNAFAVMQSTLHEVWARKYSGTLETRLRYSPTDCFATFPFPQDHAYEAALSAIGETYHEHRRALMCDLWLGLTDLYNLFHRPNLTAELITVERGEKATVSGADGLTRLLRLRELHTSLDATVLAAYGWDRASDFGPALDLRHDFHALDSLPENDRTRYTFHPDSRREILARLLKLNHQHAAAQMTVTAATAKPTKQAPEPKQPALQFPATDLPLFQPLPAAASAPVRPPSLQEKVASFDFSFPSARRPHLQTPAELYTVLLPSLVQEAGGILAYPDLLGAMSFLATPSSADSNLIPAAAAIFSRWRGTFPVALADPNALRAALHDLIVMRHALNIRRTGIGYELLRGIQWAAISHEWTLLDARLALSHVITTTHASTSPWRHPVPDADLHRWTTAA